MTAGRTPWQFNLHELIGRDEIVFDWTALRESITGRTIAITGAGGSIGTALAARLVALGAERLLLIEHHENSLFDLRRAYESASGGAARTPARFALVDVRDEDAVYQEFHSCQPHVVFHLAAYKHVPIGEENARAVIRVNLGGTLAVLDAASTAGVAALVFPSTDKAVNPPSIYGATKRAVELMLREYREGGGGPAPAVVRLVNTVGAQGGVIRTFVEQATSGLPLTITNPQMTRYWISMSEALGLLTTAADAGVFGPLTLAVGHAVTLGDVARRTWDAVRADGAVARISVIGARRGERLHEYLVREDERMVPSSYAGVFVIEPLAPVSTDWILPRLRSFLEYLPADEGTLRREIFDLIGEPLALPDRSSVSILADA